LTKAEVVLYLLSILYFIY